MKKDLTGGSVQKTMLLFAAPMIVRESFAAVL